MAKPGRRRVLYLGDGSPQTAAAYLLAIGHWAGFELHHCPSAQALPRTLWDQDWELLVISDYPAATMPASWHEQALARVRGGMGLWMIGGWASYHGQSGLWQDSPLHEALPVRIQEHDDRINCAGPAVAIQCCPHPLLEGLPFDAQPPSVGGYNRVQLRPEAQCLLEVQSLGLRRGPDQGWTLHPQAKDPLLALTSVGQGRSIAWTTDVAPHWVGGWVDWGPGRLVARHPLAREVEVGEDYAKFVARILDWGCAGGCT